LSDVFQALQASLVGFYVERRLRGSWGYRQYANAIPLPVPAEDR
jgi:hypothetical protein